MNTNKALIIIATVLAAIGMFLIGTSNAQPAFNGFITGSVGVANQEEPLLAGCNLVPGNYSLMVYGENGEPVEGIVIDYRAGRNPEIMGEIHQGMVNVHILISTTLVVVVKPKYGEQELTVLVFRR